MSKKINDPNHIRKLLLKLPDKFKIYENFAKEASKNKNDEYIISVFEIIKNSNNSNRVIPYSWEIEYDFDNCKN